MTGVTDVEARRGRLRIAHVVPALTKGGAERVAVELVRHAVTAGHDVTCIVGWPSPPPGVLHLVPDGARLMFVEPARSPMPSRYLHAARWVWQQRALLRELDVIHCHLTYGAFVGSEAALLRDLARARGPAIVETYHAVGMGISRRQRAAHRILASHRDALVLMADDPAWREFASGRPRMLLRTIANGASDPDVGRLDATERHDYRRRVGIPDDCTLVVGTVGLLRADRKPWRWIAVFAEIARAIGSHVHFLLAGGGPERERIEALIAKHGLTGRVHITGIVDEVRYPLSLIDLYVTLNVGAATGLAATEAALAGLPIIALQFMEDHDGAQSSWIWSSVREGDVAKRAIELLRDRSVRHALARMQQAYARAHHSTDTMGAAYEHVYREAIAVRSR